MTAAKKPDYQALHAELDEIVTALQQDDHDVDLALQQYARGLQIIKQLESYLKTAENTVGELKATFSE